MSYCRWSCDGYKSDVYCYEHVSGGYTTHVAGSRYDAELPPEPDFMSVTPEEFVEWHNAAHAILKESKTVPIALPHAGETFSDPDLQSLRERLAHLKSLGYHVPDHAFERIDRELEEDDLLCTRLQNGRRKLRAKCGK